MDLTNKVFSRDVNKLAKHKEKLEETLRLFDELDESDQGSIDTYTKEIIKLQDTIQKTEKVIMNKFKEYFENGFSISGYEVAKMLDVTESYLFLRLKDKIDYIKPPRVAFEYFEKEIDYRQYRIDSIMQSAGKAERELTEAEEERVERFKQKIEHLKALNRKKVFIDQHSLREFLKEYAIVDVQRVQIVINESELEHEINSRVSNRIIKEVVKFYEDRAEAKKKAKEQENPIKEFHVKLTDEVIQQLLNREITFYSPRSMKDLITKKNINELNSTVHNTQLYRFLEKKGEYTKVDIRSTVKNGRKKQNQSAIRYLLDIEIQAEMFIKAQDEDFIIFSIPVSEYHEGIKEEVIDMIDEAMRKHLERKEKDKQRKSRR